MRDLSRTNGISFNLEKPFMNECVYLNIFKVPARSWLGSVYFRGKRAYSVQRTLANITQRILSIDTSLSEFVYRQVEINFIHIYILFYCIHFLYYFNFFYYDCIYIIIRKKGRERKTERQNK